MLRRALPNPSNIDRKTQAPPSILVGRDDITVGPRPQGEPDICWTESLTNLTLPSANKTLTPPGWLLWAFEKIDSSPKLPAGRHVHMFNGEIPVIGCDDRIHQACPHATDTPADTVAIRDRTAVEPLSGCGACLKCRQDAALRS